MYTIVSRVALAGALLGVVAFFGAVVGNAEPIWYGPSVPPLSYGAFDLDLDTTGMINLSEPANQTVQGPVYFSMNNGGSYPGYFAYDTGAGQLFGAIGISGDPASPPSWPLSGDANIGVYGLAEQGGSDDIGLYAYSESGDGLVARVSSNDPSGYFYGATTVRGAIDPELEEQHTELTDTGRVYVEELIAAGEYVSIVKGAEAIYASGGSLLSGGMRGEAQAASTNGIRVDTTNWTGASLISSGREVGLVGQSSVSGAYGVYGQHSGVTLLQRGDAVYGAGHPTSATTHGVYGEAPYVGVFGISADGYAVSGYRGSDNSPVTNELSGAGVLACGIDSAAEFDGDVFVEAAVHLGGVSDVVWEGVGQSGDATGVVYDSTVSMTEDDVVDLIAVCVAEGNC